MIIENPNILNEALSQGINLFLGAGFSLDAKDVNAKNLPLGTGLVQELVDVFGLQEFVSLPLPQLCTYLKSIKRDAFLAFLIKRFKVHTFDQSYKTLHHIAAQWIFSTNIDDLPFEIFKTSSEHYLNDIDDRGPSYGDAKSIQFVSLHGSVRHPERDFIFGAEELASAFAEDNDRWRFLTQALQERPTLFIGYGVNDASVLQSLNPRSIAGRPTKEKWLLVHPDHTNVANEALFRALGFNLIKGTTRDLLSHFGNFSGTKIAAKVLHKSSTKQLFPKEVVPLLGEIPMRPAREFFLGAPPEWSDVYSQAIHPISHFTSIKDAIIAGGNIALIGAPASGKSTLLMQVAAATSIPKRKLFLSSVIPEQAQNIGTILADDACVIFVDNFTDSFEGVEVLRSFNNIQLVVADRDFMFGIVSHRVNEFVFRIFDVTELSESDLQKCISSIPPDLAIQGKLDPNFRRKPSLFEVIEAHVRLPSLKARFKGVLTYLGSKDEVMRDMLIMLCYVFSCRTPVSMDMLIAFCRNEISDWQEVARMRNELGGMITDYFGEYGASDQDYFAPRSSYLAEAVLDVVPSNLLRRVLETFHEEVSPSRTCRFDVFRKRAFDANLFFKAFPNWQEGKAFYSKIVDRDPSPYFFQQAALYLSQQMQHSEAFTMIDYAITGSKGRVWSIRNSHAIILFRANIEFANTTTGKSQLTKSMETLAECYKWDKRKFFHAFTFGQQAIQLWELIPEPQVEEYLKRAKLWVLEVVKTEPWNRQCRYLLKRLSAIALSK